MKNGKILVVAHPDDEILFFSSLLSELDKIIICFGPCSDDLISRGRERLQRSFPLRNVEWLNIEESNVYLSSNWSAPRTNADGICVGWNKIKYHENYANLVEIFRRELKDYATVYTHNPWGEYGHEDHVSVFNAVLSSIKECENEIYVSGYVSKRSEKLFKKRQHFLDAEIQVRAVPQKLCAEIKQVYIAHDCWTWNNFYEWPDLELFSRIKKGESLDLNICAERTALHPAMYFTEDFPQGNVKRIVKKILPGKARGFISSIIKSARS